MAEWRSAAEWADAAKAAGVTKDIMPLTDRGLKIAAERGAWPSRPRTKHGGGVEYPITALPEEARLLISRNEMASAIRSGEAEGLRASLQATMDARATLEARTAGLGDFLKLSTAQQREADAKALMLDLCRSYIRRLGLPTKRGRDHFSREYEAGRIPVEDWVREEVPTCSRSGIEKWEGQLKAYGLSGLASRYGQHRKGTGKIDSNPAMAAFLQAMLVEHPHAGAGLIMKGLKVRFAADDIPDVRSVQRWLKAWKEDNEQLFTRITNPDKWRSSFMAAGGDADAHIVRLNQRWEMDSTKADLLLSDGMRHVIIGVIDVFTRRMKLLVSRSSSAAGVASLLRRALLDETWGTPEQIGTDNGSDYVSLMIKRALFALDIDQDVAAPFTPEHKPFIERGLGTFSHSLVELCAGYIGHSVADRKDIEARRSFADRLMKKGEQLEMRMSPEELQQFCNEWTDNIYQHDEHGGLNGKSPWEMFLGWTGGIKLIKDERALDVLLAEAPGNDGIRTVVKKGIRLDNGWFDHPALAGMEGQQVRVRLDDADIGEIYVFDIDGQFVCKAICPERSGLNVTRQQLGMTRKAVQKKIMNEGMAKAKADAKKIGTKEIVNEIRAAAAERAGKLAYFPKDRSEHVTDALIQAGKAARSGQAPEATPVTPSQQARIDALAAEMSKPAEVITLDPKSAQFARAIDLERKLEAGEPVSDQDRRWLSTFQNSPVYKSRKAFMEEFGQAAALAI